MGDHSASWMQPFRGLIGQHWVGSSRAAYGSLRSLQQRCASLPPPRPQHKVLAGSLKPGDLIALDSSQAVIY